MTSYEYNILTRQISDLKLQVSCLAKKINECCEDDVTEPEPVCTGVTISGHPLGGSVTAGNNFTMSVSVSGDSPITFQWKKDSIDITGATSGSYSITNASSADAGSYSVTITNPCSVVNSNATSVNVDTPVQPVIIYSGWIDAPGITSTSQITSLQNTQSITTGQNISANYSGNSAPKYLVMSEPVTEPLKTKWYGSDFNNGNIGNLGDLFSYSVVGVYRVYITSYQTQQTQTPIIFRIN